MPPYNCSGRDNSNVGYVSAFARCIDCKLLVFLRIVRATVFVHIYSEIKKHTVLNAVDCCDWKLRVRGTVIVNPWRTSLPHSLSERIRNDLLVVAVWGAAIVRVSV